MTVLRCLTGWFALVAGAAAAFAQIPHTAHTLKLDEGQSSPAATIEDIAWLAGAWTGEAFGGVAEETWNPPSAGTMVGLFKLMHDDQPSMYEIQLLVQEEGSLVWKVKHFNADFSAWEDKPDFVSFPLVKVTEDGAWFEGLTLERDGPDRLNVYLVLTHDGETSEEKLVYHRMRDEG